MSVSAKRFYPKRASIVGRGQVSALAKSEPERAFALARTIPDGWYRCQAMATIAGEAPDALADRTFTEARAAAAAGDDDYQRSAVLAFVLMTALRRGRKDLAAAIIDDALALIPTVEPMASRAFALSCLWSTTAHLGDRVMRERVLAAATAHCHPDRNWRAKRLYRDIVADLAWDRPDLADELIRQMPDGKARAFVQRRRLEGERRRP